MAEKKTIILRELRGGQVREFGFEHALNLLRLQAEKGNNGWEIADEKWKFENNEICRREQANRNSKKPKAK